MKLLPILALALRILRLVAFGSRRCLVGSGTKRLALSVRQNGGLAPSTTSAHCWVAWSSSGRPRTSTLKVARGHIINHMFIWLTYPGLC